MSSHISSRVTSIIVTLTATLVFTAPAVNAQVEQVTLRVDGLACPFCAYGVEKKLKKLKGYRSLDVLMNEGKIVIGWKSDEPVDLPGLNNAIKEAGFTLRSVKATLVGVVENDKGRYSLVLPAMLHQRFYLYESEKFSPGAQSHQQNERQAETLSAPLRKRLDDLSAESGTVRIAGLIRQQADAQLGLELGVEKFTNLSPASETNDG